MNVARPAEIVRLVPGDIHCDGGAVSPIRLELPFISSTRRFGPDGASAPPLHWLDFAIDADGRPVHIRSGPIAYPGFFVETGDLAPSLAASRFPSGAPKTGCRISYQTRLTPISMAPLPLLYEAASIAFPGPAQTDVFNRLNEGADCAQGSPRRLNYPDFQAITQAPGTRSWSFLTFDIDLRGRTRNVRVLGSSGNGALDAASVKALRANLYAAGRASYRCTFHFYRLGNRPLEAPEIPGDAPGETGEPAVCAIELKTMSAAMEGTIYPAAFAARGIEGYAIIGFDTAPWGGIGNAKVLASEPDQSFGQAALQAVASAKVPESETGHRGCVRRFKFRMPGNRPAG